MPEALTLTPRALAPGAASAEDMVTWKAMASESARSGAVLTLEYSGAANRITSYRLFYMLSYAKQVGVRRVVFRGDVSHWDAEAREWLAESPADETVLI